MEISEAYNKIVCQLAGVSDPNGAPFALERVSFAKFSPAAPIQVFVFSGPSASGKGTLAVEIEKFGVGRIPRDHTRDRRPGEIDGVHYNFLTRDKFMEHVAKGRYLWWTDAKDGIPRGLRRDVVDQVLKDHRAGYIDGGGESAKEIPPLLKEQGYRVAVVFVLAPSFEELERRLRLRAEEDGMVEEEIQRRLRHASLFLEETRGLVDLYLVNDKLEEIPSKVETLLRALRIL